MRQPTACLLAFALPVLVTTAPSSLAGTRIDLKAKSSVTAPALSRPMDERRFDFEDPAAGIVEMAWDASRGAALYRLQVSAKDDFSEPTNRNHQLVLGEHETRAEIAGLPAGGYYVRVAAIDSEGRQGSWSPVRRFSVNQGAPPATGEGPALVITNTVAAGSMVIVHGTATAGVRVEASVNGVLTNEVTVGDEGSFSLMVEANTIGRNAVKLMAIDRSGRSTTQDTSFYYGG